MKEMDCLHHSTVDDAEVQTDIVKWQYKRDLHQLRKRQSDTALIQSIESQKHYTHYKISDTSLLLSCSI